MMRRPPSKSRILNNKKEPSTSEDNRVPHLEDYIVQLEKRDVIMSSSSSNGQHQSMNNSVMTKSDSTSEDAMDVYSQLAQKDQDLILAAELGKALLERNEDLTRANERITEEYSAKLELLEQEKHGLRRRLDTLESEYESRLLELQTDLTSAQKQLEDHQNNIRASEKDKSRMIQELMQQNHRLTQELKDASESEDNVSHQLQSLREQFNVRRNNLHDHVAQLEGLREEITILGKRKGDLEKRLSILTDERSQLTMSLEESSDRILLLEKKNQELEHAIRSQYKELEELRHANCQLQNKMDRTAAAVNSRSVIASTASDAANSPSNQPTSLYNEIEMSSSSSIEEELCKTFSGHHDSDEDIECDLTPSVYPLMDDSWKSRQEIMSIYQSLRAILRDLHRRRETSSGSMNSTPDSGVPATPEEIQVDHIRVGLVSSLIREIQTILKEIFPEDDEPCFGCRSVAMERNELVKLRKDDKDKSEAIKRMNEEMNELTRKVTIQEVQLNAIREERDNARLTLESQGLPKDEIVKRAFELRDQAVARKNNVEIELAKTRIEVMHINSQLMESVQQKVELSQQLEQWQVDMQELLDEQLKRKLNEDKKRLSSLSSSNHPPPLLSSSKVLFEKTRLTTTGLMNKSKLLKLWR